MRALLRCLQHNTASCSALGLLQHPQQLWCRALSCAATARPTAAGPHHIHASAAQCFSTAAPLQDSIQQSPEDSQFVGAFTPVTRQLWQERLKLVHQHISAPAQTAAQAMAARPPKQTVISYPFTTDKVLLELVSV